MACLSRPLAVPGLLRGCGVCDELHSDVRQGAGRGQLQGDCRLGCGEESWGTSTGLRAIGAGTRPAARGQLNFLVRAGGRLRLEGPVLVACQDEPDSSWVRSRFAGCPSRPLWSSCWISL